MFGIIFKLEFRQSGTW